jgi:hypothetical protein
LLEAVATGAGLMRTKATLRMLRPAVIGGTTHSAVPPGAGVAGSTQSRGRSAPSRRLAFLRRPPKAAPVRDYL